MVHHTVRGLSRARAGGARHVAPLSELPCASGTCGTQEAGARTPSVRHGCGTLWLPSMSTQARHEGEEW